MHCRKGRGGRWIIARNRAARRMRGDSAKDQSSGNKRIALLACGSGLWRRRRSGFVFDEASLFLFLSFEMGWSKSFKIMENYDDLHVKISVFRIRKKRV
jgi:hypothetical protein